MENMQALPNKWCSVHTMILVKNWHKQSPTAIAKEIGFDVNVVLKRADKLGLSSDKRPWLKRELRFLEDNWGNLDFPILSLKLGRSKKDILAKVKELDLLDAEVVSGQYLPVRFAADMIGVHHTQMFRWKREGRLKTVLRNLSGIKKTLVEYEYFLTWAKENQDDWDATKIKRDNWGFEPDWLLEKIKKDIAKKNRQQASLKK